MSEDENDKLDAQLLKQMREDFIEESHELLDQLDLHLTRLESSPEDTDIIDEIFRIVHTIKGSSSFSGLTGMATLAHKMEDVLGEIRRGEITADVTLIDIMFEAMKALTLLRDKAVAWTPGEVDISMILNKLEQIQTTECASIPVTEGTQETESADKKNQNAKADLPDIQSPHVLKEAATIRVPTERLDEMMNMIGELITSRNRLLRFTDELKNEDLTAISAPIDRLTGQLHKSIMGVRMVPVEKLFIRFPGVVRNLAREKNKQVELILEGKETELDKTIIEEIYDPLVHLLRNSIDHGIEDSETRRKQNKSPIARIRISARHEQNNVFIEIEDDGQGIDPREIKEIALKKGIFSMEEIQSMTDDQAIRLVFLPGFSTSDKVTEISGRGVGLDVVKENVQKLRGIIDIKTAVGKGTTFRIQLPLTLAILQVLLVNVNGLPYAIPLNTVVETLLVSQNEIRTMEKQEVIFIRDQAHPLKHIGSVLKHHSTGDVNTTARLSKFQTKKTPVVVVGLAEKRVALCVDELLDKQEVVMKSPGNYLGRVAGIEGASILADGSVTLIVDIEAVLERDEHEIKK